MSLMVNGPQPGDESYDQYVAEKKEILASLRRRAHMMTVHAADAQTSRLRRTSGPQTCLCSLFTMLDEVMNP
jgi:hypothetical protein